MVYVKELTDNNYKSFVESGLSLVDVWAPWCGPCKQIGPIVDELSSDFVGKLNVGKLNADENSETVTELGVRSIPTLVLYKNGQVVERLVGLSSKQKLTDLVNKYL